MKRIGLLGGSFNPIHLGHLHLAESVRNVLHLDRVLFIPTGINPFKDKKKEISDIERYAMVEMAIADNPFFEICDIEISKTGKSYTIDTVRELKQIYPEAELYFITGADIMFEITRWRDAEELLKTVNFVSCCRPGYSLKKFDKRIAELKEQYGANIIKLFPAEMDIASSIIRNYIAKGFSIRYLVPEMIEEYIVSRGLYTEGYSESRAEEELIKFRLQKILKPSRYQHTLNVMECAEVLALKYHCDIRKARLAALLHDCAKNFSDEQLIEIAESEKLESDEVILSEPQLLHGPVGSIIAEREYGIKDEEVLNAIKYHTTGRVAMTDLEKIIYLADFIEPGRNFPGVDKLRKAAEVDLDQAMIIALTNTIRYVTSIGGLIHGRTLDARNQFILDSQQTKEK